MKKSLIVNQSQKKKTADETEEPEIKKPKKKAEKRKNKFLTI